MTTTRRLFATSLVAAVALASLSACAGRTAASQTAMAAPSFQDREFSTAGRDVDSGSLAVIASPGNAYQFGRNVRH